MKKRAKRNPPRLKEEPGEGYGRSLKGRTPNAQSAEGRIRRGERSTSNVQRRLKEEPSGDYAPRSKGRTPNAQRPTPNLQLGESKRYDLEERLLEYAARIIRLVDKLPATRAGRHVADQLLRCGTSPQANHGELQGAESRKDFIHKLGICLKEIEESWRWLRLIHRVPMLPPSTIEPLLDETKALIKIFAASIRTAEENKR